MPPMTPFINHRHHHHHFNSPFKNRQCSITTHARFYRTIFEGALPAQIEGAVVAVVGWVREGYPLPSRLGVWECRELPHRSPNDVLAYFEGHRRHLFADALSSLNSVLCHIWRGARPRIRGNCPCPNVELRLSITYTIWLYNKVYKCLNSCRWWVYNTVKSSRICNNDVKYDKYHKQKHKVKTFEMLYYIHPREAPQFKTTNIKTV